MTHFVLLAANSGRDVPACVVWPLLFASVIPFTLHDSPIASLAAVRIYTGCTLAYPKVVPKLLEGVLTGLVPSLLKLREVFSRLEVRVEKESESKRTPVRRRGIATLIRLAQAGAAVLEARPPTQVHVHFEHLDYIDND